jgi:putative phosphoribosyl transferase
MNGSRFRDRREAGAALGRELKERVDPGSTLILALPRGGVPIGYEVAREVGAPLDIFLVRKLGVPGHQELAMGAIASGGVRVMNDEVVSMLRIPPTEVNRVAEAESAELERREREYRGDRAPPVVEGRTVVLVDDGLATGSTMRAAAKAVKLMNPARIIVAVPVAPRETCEEIGAGVDEVVCLRMPEPFHAVGLWYASFEQTTDEEVKSLLAAQG